MATPKPFRSASFFSTDNGATVQRRASAQEEQMAALPNNITNIYRFDETQVNNANLLAAWVTNAAQFTMSGNTVLKQGQAAGFDPPSLLYRALENWASLWSKMETTSDPFTREEQAQLGAIGGSAKGLLI